MMGQAMQYEQKHVMPGGYSAVVKMGPMELMKQSKNGSEYSAAMQGTKQEVSADDKAQLDAKAALYDERYYLSNAAVKLNLKGIESVDGKDAYDIEIVTPEGSSFHAFYDVKTGLKVQEMRQQEVGPMGKVNVTTLYKEYKEFNGVKIPVQIVIDLGVMKQDISITEVKINAGLSASEL